MSLPIYSIEDARRIARRKLPRLVFDYFDGGVADEYLNKRNTSDLDSIRLRPRALVNVESRDIGTQFLGQRWEMPFGIAPMGMAGLAWANADSMLAKASVKFDIPWTLSTMASCSMENAMKLAKEQCWYQLYVAPNREMTMDLVTRIENCGYQTLILTVDVPEVSIRPRDVANGFKAPFSIGPSQFFDFALHPHWSTSMMLSGKPQLENVRGLDESTEFTRADSRAWADWEFLKILRDRWKGNLLVKGIMNAEDASKAKQAGVDGIYVSNHGGRQLNSAPSAISVLPEIRQIVGSDFPLIFDSGIRNGDAIVKALASGADFVMLGRPLLYAIGAARQKGLEHVISLLGNEIKSTMAQIGCTDIESIDINTLAWNRPGNTSLTT